MLLAQLIVTLLALFGHFALWIAVFNRLHASAAVGLPPPAAPMKPGRQTVPVARIGVEK